MGRDASIGQLAPGKLADFIVLDRAFTPATSAAEVRKTLPTHTFFAGQQVWPAH